MNTQYFAGLKDQTEIKALYKNLVFKHHPDKGGDTATMQDINAQYSDVMRGIYQTKATEENRGEESVDWWMEQEGMIFEKISQLIKLEGLEIELLGVWIWVTGNTKEHKKELGKDGIGCRWSKDKNAWYWRSSEHSFYRKSQPKKSLDELRSGFKSRKAKSLATPRLAYAGN